MNTQHTLGPWKATPGNCGVTDANGDRVCIMDCAGKRNFGLHHMEANSHLIAAAPELLEACIAAVEADESNDREGSTSRTVLRLFASKKAIRAAIAKATGNAQA